MTITYRFSTPIYPSNILYVNITPNYTCINNCVFCSRPRTKKDFHKPNIYETKAGTSLYLKKSPTLKEIITEINYNIDKNDKELAIIGLGKPLIHLPKVIQILKYVKKNYKIKTRIDTNGLVDCIYNNSAKKLKNARLDEIRISLNATNEKDYLKLCRPKYKDAWPKLLKFIKDCKNEEINTFVSFVVDYKNKKMKIDTSNKEDFVRFAKSLGIKKEKVILRKYLKPI